MSSYQSGLQLGQELGSGCFGTVYLGDDPVLGRVAVKIFERDAGESEDEWSIRRHELLEEGKMLAAAEHDRVVRVYQVLEADDASSIALVMQLCEGGSLLSEYESGPLRLSAVREVLTDAALGLQALHSRRLLHRDLKPSNLLRDANGRAKLGDFGLVTDRLVLGYGSRVGYADHVAYEVHLGHGTSEKSDIWALGMTAYRLLHGAVWYLMQDYYPDTDVPQGNFARGLRWLPHVPNDWRRFVRAALHDDPSGRIQTASEFLKRLAPLSVAPDWDCTVEDGKVCWTRSTARGRTHQVTWTWSSPRRHEWHAVSVPGLTGGRQKRLGGSSGPAGRIATISSLEAFFRDQKA